MSSFVEAAVTSEPLELCWFRGGCHWETASEMILVELSRYPGYMRGELRSCVICVTFLRI
jgi:hypothetical protein